ncbi:hypothetical protein [Rufibacter immobilis]|uniref:hypothetical protein n=1 Tax=Rufibacter immobilis TaxID=1348778 RepID=UPI0035E55602
MAYTRDLPGIFASQHHLIKKLKKEYGLRQRDWEILCACHQLSLSKFTFTTAKVEQYLLGSYYLPSIYESMNLLVTKGYLNILVPGKPFQPERYDLSFKGIQLVKMVCDEVRRISEEQQYKISGRYPARLW